MAEYKNQARSNTAFQLLKVIGLMPGEADEAAALKQLTEGSIQNKPISHVLTELLKANESGNRQEFILNLAKLNGFISQRSESSGQAQTLETLFNDIRNGKIFFPAERNLLNALFKSALSYTLNADLGQLLSDPPGLKQAAVQAGGYLPVRNLR